MGCEFSRALQAFVDASVDGLDWRDPLTRAEQAMGVRGVILQGIENFAGRMSAVFETSQSVPVESVERYQDFLGRDIRANSGAAVPTGTPVTDEMLGDLAHLDRTDIYAGLFRPYDLGRFIGVRLGSAQPARGAERSLFLTVLRTNDSAHNAALNAQAVALAHVVQGSLRSAAAFSALRAESDAKSAALDKSPFGWILVGERQSIIDLNKSGAQFLERNDGLSSQSGKLVVDDRNIQNALERATSTTASLVKLPERYALARRDFASPYILTIVPMRYDVGNWLAGGKRITAAVFIVDPLAKGIEREAIWRSAFGLTHAEADVARLFADGLSLPAIAAARSVSLTTVKVQMKRLYAKLGVNTQAQAAALLLRSAPY